MQKFILSVLLIFVTVASYGQSPRLRQREYFIDTDPGPGHGAIALLSAADSIVDTILSIPTTGLTAGAHVVYVRYADTTGEWGQVQSAQFTITGSIAEVSSPRLAKHEYFFDTDPGPGNGILLPTTVADSATDTFFAITTTGLSAGPHLLFFRYADTTGKWGQVNAVSIVITGMPAPAELAAPRIAKREYFIDTDPGAGNGIGASIAISDSVADTILSISTVGLAAGSHTLYLRYADSTGVWGQVQSTGFAVTGSLPSSEVASPRISQREYFIDTDPGPGSGIVSITAVADSVADTILSIPTAGLTPGWHALYIRYADSAGKWGQVQSASFNITGAASPAEVAAPRLRKREYFIDVDPGPGFGVDFTIAVSDSVADTILSVATLGLATGSHMLYVRYMDTAGTWGQVQGISFAVTGTIAETQSPRIRKREYFVDTDPGAGNGTVATLAIADSVTDVITGISTTGLPLGAHMLYVRYADSTGVWGQVQSQPFTVSTVALLPPSPPLFKREYFIDTDRGPGLGTVSLTTVADSLSDTIMSIPTTGLSLGGHVLYIRYADTAGNWGLVQSHPFTISIVGSGYSAGVSPAIIQREYFIDTDPGVGNGTLSSIAAADSVADTMLSIATTGLAAGPHTLYIRYADTAGKWGQVQPASFVISGMAAPAEVLSPRIRKREYFIDTDPGVGNGIVTIEAYADSVTDTVIAIPTTGLLAGNHAIYFRYADSTGHWGQVQAAVFTIPGATTYTEVAMPKIRKREYFVDTDPGPGLGMVTLLPVADSVADTILSISTVGLASGGHIIYVRYADTSGVWGQVQSAVFNVSSTIPPAEVAMPRIVKREYFIDIDPGPGNGFVTSFAAADSVADTILAISTTGLDSGGHILYVRYADSTGKWGQTQTALFRIISASPFVETQSPRLVKEEYFVDTDPGPGNGTVVAISAADSITDSTLSIPTTGLAIGSHRIYMRYADSAGRWGQVQSLPFNVIAATPIAEVQSPRLVKKEYFIDIDPGAGHGTVSSIAAADSVSETIFSISTTGLSAGGHILYVRYADSAGTWGQVQSALFTVTSVAGFTEVASAPIRKGEYFIDTDPGQGNGTALPAFATADSAALSLSVPTTGLTSGFHSAYIRFCDTAGHWSATQSLPINVCTPAITLSAISCTGAICLGSATTATDTATGGFWSSSNPSVATINASGLVNGLAGGTTILTYSKTNACGTAIVTQALSVANTFVSASSTSPTICSGSAVGITAFGAASYSWSPSAGLSATTGASVIASPTVSTTYTITGTDAYGCASVTTNLISVTASPVVTCTPASMSICAGGSVSLSAAGAGIYSWAPAGSLSASTGSSVSVTPGTTTTYTVTGTDIHGCTATATALIGVAPLVTVGPIAGSSAVCLGSTTTLTDSVSSGVWSSTDTTIAAVSSSGVVSGMSVGSVTISYTKSNSCFSASTSKVLTVNGLPAVSISAAPAVCQGTTIASRSYTVTAGTPVTYTIVYDATAHAAGFTDVTAATLSGGTITQAVPALAPSGTYNGTFTVSNGTCQSSPAAISVVVNAAPVASITSAVRPCNGYATNIVFTGTSGATIDYTVDSGATAHAVLTGGTFTLPTVAMTTSHHYHLIDVHTATCSTSIGIDSTIVPQQMQWIGAVDSNWNNAANWSCGFVPGAPNDVRIPAGTPHTPTLAISAIDTVNSLIVDSGVSIVLNGSSLLNVKGKLTNSSNVNGSGILSMMGASVQLISGFGNISNLDINNPSGVTIDTVSRVIIRNELSLSHGTFATNDSLVLNSDSASTARLNTIVSVDARVTGNVLVRHYIPGGHRAFRFFGHPFNAQIPISQLEKSIDVTGSGGAANGFTATITNAPSCFRYNPLIANSSLGYDPGWKAFTATSGAADSNLFHQYQGIRLFIRGAKGEGLDGISYTPSPVTVAMSGQLNQGSLTIHLQKGTGANSDYNMVANPYASPVDIGTVVHNAKVAGNIIGSAIYVWNPYLGAEGQFQAIPIDSTIPYSIEACASFQVRAAHNGDSLNFYESNKTQTSSNTLLRTSASDYITISVYDVNYHPWDKLMLRFNNAATEAEDNDYDALKPSGPADLNFYSLSSDNKKMAIDTRPYEADKVIPLGVTSSIAQEFIFKVDGMASVKEGDMYLHDKLLNKFTQLSQGTEYKFAITADKNTQGDNRFEITTKLPETVVAQLPLQVSMQPNPASEEVKVSFSARQKENTMINITDISGVSVYSKDLGAQQNGYVIVPLDHLASGMYMVEITSGDRKVVQRLVKE